MATISFIGVGTFASGAQNVTINPGLPTAIEGDLLLLVVCTPNQTVNAPAGGWVEVGTQANSGTGTAGAAGAVRVAVFYRFFTAGLAAPSVSGTWNMIAGQIASFRNVDRLDPFNATANATQAALATTFTFPAVTTDIPNSQIVNCLGNDQDGNVTNGITGAANASLVGFGTAFDRAVNTNTGGGVAMFYGRLANAGSSGATTGTKTGTGASSRSGFLTIGLRPKRRVITVTQ